MTTKEIPKQLKLLDKKKVSATSGKSAADLPIRSSPDKETESKETLPSETMQGYRNCPKTEDWLRKCAEDSSRALDGHDFMSVADMLMKNEFTRLSDIALLEHSDFDEMSSELGIRLSRGLVKRIISFAKQDMQLLKEQEKERKYL